MSRMLLISDLHMHNGNPNTAQASSYLSSDEQYDAPLYNPLNGIDDLLRKENLYVDWILCGGDIAEQGNREALRKGWSALNRLKLKLGAKLISTVGNHDLDSRRSDPSEKPNGTLRTLSPLFPTARRARCTHYWADDVTSIDDSQLGTRVVVLNSCAFHGLSTSLTVEEYNHGRITRESFGRLRSIVRSKTRRKNVLLVHHHLRPHPQVGADASVAVGGEQLLALLAGSGQQWLVIHGHEHLSYLGYEGSNAHTPIIFSAGSIASTRLRHVPRRLTTNQLYYINLPDGPNAPGCAELFGEVRAWDWYPMSGWQPAHHDAGIPYFCGFGVRTGLALIADSIDQMVASVPTGFVAWRDAWDGINGLSYLVPSDQADLFGLLDSKKVKVVFGSQGAPFGFARES
jgi:predicted phosphodiesterase